MNRINLSSSLNLNKQCNIENCLKAHYIGGFCAKHYQRWKHNGNPLTVKNNKGEGDTPLERFWSRVAITSDDERCWLWQCSVNRFGYGRIIWKGKRLLTHVVSFEIYNGRKAENLVLHTCDVPACVNPKHLYDGTHQDNAEDKIARGRTIKGEQSHKAKLTERDVIIIRERLKRGETLRGIAKDYSVNHAAIKCIKHRQTWKHI